LPFGTPPLSRETVEAKFLTLPKSTGKVFTFGARVFAFSNVQDGCKVKVGLAYTACKFNPFKRLTPGLEGVHCA